MRSSIPEILHHAHHLFIGLGKASVGREMFSSMGHGAARRCSRGLGQSSLDESRDLHFQRARGTQEGTVRQV